MRNFNLFGYGLISITGTAVTVLLIQLTQIGTVQAETREGDIGRGAVKMTGKALYEQSCLVCHGEDGEAVMPGVKDLSGANGPLLQDDKQLARSIREGVQRDGAMMMPPLGGNPRLTDNDIQKIILYMRKNF